LSDIDTHNFENNIGGERVLIKIERKHFSYAYDRNNKPVAFASAGDKVIFETLDCFGDHIRTEDDHDHPGDVNPTTGPLFINDAKPGDILVLKILDIKCEDHGVLMMIPSEGVLRKFVDAPYTKIVKIENGKTIFNEDLSINNKPHVGTIGTTPVGKIPTRFIGNHGGNIDCPEAGIGASIYLPVFVEGALLQIGDVHANMGECEICIGVECGAEVTIEIVKLIRNIYIPAPIIEQKDYWYTLATAPALQEAVRIGCKRMADFLCHKLGVSIEEATLLISIVGNVRIGQADECDAGVSIFVQFPKYVDSKERLSVF